MNARNIVATITVVLGLAIIVAAYYILGESLTAKVMWLDIVVSVFFYLQLFQLGIYPLILGERPVSIKVGKMGRHFYGLHLCALVAIATIVLGIVIPIPFKYQLFIQVLVLLFVMEGRAVLLRMGEKMVKEYQEEGLIDQEIDPAASFHELLRMMAADPLVAPSIREKMVELDKVASQLRPSSHKVARLLDNQIILTMADIKVLLGKGDYNKKRLEEEVSCLGLLLARRRNCKI